MADEHFIRILTINRGSSSLKFALYDMGESETLVLFGNMDKLDLPTVFFHIKDGAGKILVKETLELLHHDNAVSTFLERFKSYVPDKDLDAVGHRVVHGGTKFIQPHLVTPKLISSLKEIIPFDPNHLPQEIEAIKAVNKVYPTLKQVACFDTAFHRSMPDVAQIFAIPRFLRSEGVIRYGFHGLSYEFIMNELENEAGPEVANSKVIIAHLGNGASMTAVKGGKSVDTTMGFTPASGLMMSTRAGDLDPGVIIYLMKRKSLSPSAVNNMVNKQSGLLGVSETSSHMEELLAKEEENPHAAEAVNLFCYQAKKFLGALVAALGGIDTLIFTAGIGENAPSIRWRICEDMRYLGINLDLSRNNINNPVISSEDSPVTVRVMKTNEQLMIARHTRNLIQSKKGE